MRGSDQLRTYRRTESVVFLKTDEPFGGLSNMAGGYPIHVNGVRILTSEALYQVCRFPHLPDVQRMIISQISPMTAKMRSKPYRKDSRLDWDQVRVRIMRWCLRMKLANNWSTFSELLLRTGERPIVEESRKDDFWGAKTSGDGSTLVGMNVLGRLLMELREQVKQQGREAALDVTPPSIPQFLLLGRPIEVTPGSAPSREVADHEQGSLFSSETATNVQPSAPRVEAAAYPNYRMSGLPWVPQIPEDWQVLRNGRLFGHRVETGFPDLPILEVSLRTGVRVRDMENLKRKQVMSQKEKYKRAVKDDLAYNMMRMWQGAVGPAPVDGLVSPAYVVVKPYDEANSSYYSYLFRTAAYMQEVNKFSRGIVADRNRLYWESFKQMPSLVPPRPEQKQIVAYLRAQDAHIARFIKAKRELIKLLTEQKLRIINHAVTRGLDASATLKPSAVAWLGDVPAHWEVLQLRRVSRCLDGARIPLNATERGLRQGSYPYWGANKVIDHLDKWLFDEPLVLLGEDGAPFFDKTKEVAFAVSGKIWVNNHAHVLRPSSRITPQYLAHALNCVDYTGFVDGSTRDKLTQQSMKSIRIPLPEVSEQIEICKHIETACAPLNVVIERTEREVALIREYRDRLIADVVTGQVDVRGWQPGPEDVVDDVALAALGDDQEEVTEEENGDGED